MQMFFSVHHSTHVQSIYKQIYGLMGLVQESTSLWYASSSDQVRCQISSETQNVDKLVVGLLTAKVADTAVAFEIGDIL